MAVYSQLSAGDISSIDDMQKVRDYLYKLNKNLTYMFNNLTPEDNYSEMARLTLVTDGDRQASIEATLEGINLNYVSKDGIVSAINLSEELIQIEASKIKLEGMVTVNGYFKVGLDGSIEAKNGKFTGDISASTITGSTIDGGHIYGSYYGSRTSNSFFIIAEDDVTVVGVPGFEFKNKKMASNWTAGGVANPALGNGDERAGINGNNGYAGFTDVYLLRTQNGDSWMWGDTGPIESGQHLWSVLECLEWLDGRITSLENQCWTDCGGDGSDEESCGGDGCMCENECDDLSCPCYTVD